MGLRLADVTVLSDAGAPWLEPFVAPECGGAAASQRAATAGPKREVFRGRAWVAGEEREVVCSESSAGIRIDCAGSRPFLVSQGGRMIAAEPLRDGAPTPLELEVLFGPALLVALAERDLYALHASAIATPSGAIAFTGASGAGKSTLAAAGDRVADDLLPIRLDASGTALALPRFPQLKLAPEQQVDAAHGEAFPVAAVFELDAVEDATGVTLARLGGADALALLVAATVAAKLFPTRLLERHLEHCGRLAEAVTVGRLRYPRSLAAVPEVVAAVTAWCATEATRRTGVS